MVELNESAFDTQVSDEPEAMISVTTFHSPSATTSAHDPKTVGRGTLIGRYLILSELGSGAMGIVFEAYDPELDRKVAIKVLKNRNEGAVARLRLQREAQALAKLDHPNVIRVYDVAQQDGQIFISMELVEGQTLATWMKSEHAKTWRDVVRVFRAAGRGLAAAHRAKLVHRDFKPENVMIGVDERVKVMDFGLARGDGDEQLPNLSESLRSIEPLVSPDLLIDSLTRTGVIMGTPAYMAPEQFSGSQADKYSDQFSFCVSLYEALYGERPYRGATIAKLLDALRAGHTREAPPDTTVPMWLRRVVLRGLEIEYFNRFDGMGTLLDAIDTGEQRRDRTRRRAYALTCFVALALALAVVLAAFHRSDARALAACETQVASLDDAWLATQREAINAAYARADASYANATLLFANLELDRHIDEFAATRTKLCAAKHRGELSTQQLRAGKQCLEQRTGEFEIFVERLARADAVLVENTVQMFAAFPSLQRCAEPEDLDHSVPVGGRAPELRQEIQDDLFFAALLTAEGQQSRALELFTEVLERARAYGEPSLLALVLTRGVAMYVSARELERGEPLANEAVFLTEKLNLHDLGIDALTNRAKLLSDVKGRWDDAQTSLDLARAKYAREPGGTRGEWILHYVQSNIHLQHRRYEQSIAQLELALDKVEGVGVKMNRAKILNALASSEELDGRLDAAEAHVSESLELRLQLYGPAHPSLMYPHRTLAKIMAERKIYSKALDHVDQAIALGKRSYGDDASGLIEPFMERARYLRDLGRDEDALAAYQESQRLNRVNGRSAADPLRLQSQVLLRLGRPHQALAHAEAAILDSRKFLGRDEQVPWLRARLIMHRGEALLELERFAQALIDFERAATLRMAEQRDTLLVRIWVGEGYSQLGLGERKAARQAFARARTHRSAGHEPSTRTIGLLEFGLAKVATNDAASAEHAQLAIAAFESSGTDVELAQEVRVWLAQ